MTDNKTAGSILRAARKFAGYTQAELAKQAGLSTRTVTMLETGRKTTFRTETLRAVAEVLNIDAAPLIAAYAGGLPPSAAPVRARPSRGKGLRNVGTVSTDPALLAETIDAMTRVVNAAGSVQSAELRASIDAFTPLSDRLFTVYAHIVLDDHPRDHIVAAMLAKQLTDHQSDASVRRERLVARLEHMEKLRPRH